MSPRPRGPARCALVLVSAYGRLRRGEAVGLTRANVDVLRSRIIVETTAIEVRGKVTLGQEPKTRRSKRTVSVARSVMRRLEHLVRVPGRKLSGIWPGQSLVLLASPTGFEPALPP